jgi:hypothetical protein
MMEIKEATTNVAMTFLRGVDMMREDYHTQINDTASLSSASSAISSATNFTNEKLRHFESSKEVRRTSPMNPFYEIWNDENKLVARSAIFRHDANPNWPPLRLDMNALCQGDLTRNFHISCYDMVSNEDIIRQSSNSNRSNKDDDDNNNNDNDDENVDETSKFKLQPKHNRIWYVWLGDVTTNLSEFYQHMMQFENSKKSREQTFALSNSLYGRLILHDVVERVASPSVGTLIKSSLPFMPSSISNSEVVKRSETDSVSFSLLSSSSSASSSSTDVDKIHAISSSSDENSVTSPRTIVTNLQDCQILQNEIRDKNVQTEDRSEQKLHRLETSLSHQNELAVETIKESEDDLQEYLNTITRNLDVHLFRFISMASEKSEDPSAVKNKSSENPSIQGDSVKDPNEIFQNDISMDVHTDTKSCLDRNVLDNIFGFFSDWSMPSVDELDTSEDILGHMNNLRSETLSNANELHDRERSVLKSGSNFFSEVEDIAKTMEPFSHDFCDYDATTIASSPSPVDIVHFHSRKSNEDFMSIDKTDVANACSENTKCEMIDLKSCPQQQPQPAITTMTMKERGNSIFSNDDTILRTSCKLSLSNVSLKREETISNTVECSRHFSLSVPSSEDILTSKEFIDIQSQGKDSDEVKIESSLEQLSSSVQPSTKVSKSSQNYACYDDDYDQSYYDLILKMELIKLSAGDNFHRYMLHDCNENSRYEKLMKMPKSYRGMLMSGWMLGPENSDAECIVEQLILQCRTNLLLEAEEWSECDCSTRSLAVPRDKASPIMSPKFQTASHSNCTLNDVTSSCISSHADLTRCNSNTKNTIADTANVIEEVYDYFLNWSMPDDEALDTLGISGEEVSVFPVEDIHEYEGIELGEKLFHIESVLDLPIDPVAQHSYVYHDDIDDSVDNERYSLDDGISCQANALTISQSPGVENCGADIISAIDSIGLET